MSLSARLRAAAWTHIQQEGTYPAPVDAAGVYTKVPHEVPDPGGLNMSAFSEMHTANAMGGNWYMGANGQAIVNFICTSTQILMSVVCVSDFVFTKYEGSLSIPDSQCHQCLEVSRLRY